MTLDLAPIVMFVSIAFGVMIFILLLFLPALFELRNPRDAGPRKIMSETVDSENQMKITSMERNEEIAVDQALLKKVASVISVLPDLET